MVKFADDEPFWEAHLRSALIDEVLRYCQTGLMGINLSCVIRWHRFFANFVSQGLA